MNSAETISFYDLNATGCVAGDAERLADMLPAVTSCEDWATVFILDDLPEAGDEPSPAVTVE